MDRFASSRFLAAALVTATLLLKQIIRLADLRFLHCHFTPKQTLSSGNFCRESADGGVVPGDARQADFRPRDGKVDHRDLLPSQRTDEAEHRFVVPQRHEGAVAVPSAERVREAVDHRKMPSVRLGDAGDAREAPGRGRGDVYQYVFRGHAANYTIIERNLQSSMKIYNSLPLPFFASYEIIRP